MIGMGVLIPIVVFLAGVMLVLATYRLLTQKQELVKGRLASYSIDIGFETFTSLSSGILRQHRLSSFRSLERILMGSEWGERVALDLARAGIPLRVGEYLLLRWLVALALFGVGTFLTKGLVAGIALGVCGYFFPRFYVKHCEQKRIRKFDDHLVDSLSLMANALRAGFGLLQGIEAVSREMPDPISEEFKQVLHEITVGASAEEALVNLTRRVRSADLDLIVTAMLIQRAVGGNLAEILDTIAHTIRERMRILREIRTLTAQERLSGYVIGALPIFLLVVISVVNSSYISMLFYSDVGRLMLGAAALLEILGFYITRKIIAIEV